MSLTEQMLIDGGTKAKLVVSAYDKLISALNATIHKATVPLAVRAKAKQEQGKIERMRQWWLTSAQNMDKDLMAGLDLTNQL